MVPKTEFSASFLDSHFATAINRPNDYGGFDGLVLGNLARIFNFNVTRVVPKLHYGQLLPNNTFTGAIGDVLYGRSEVAFNARFIQDYETNEIDFLFPVFTDRFCIVVPASTPVPVWKAIFSGFHDGVWISFCMCLLVCTIFWYFVNNLLSRRQSDAEVDDLANDDQILNNHRTFVDIFLDMWLIFLAGSTTMPRQTVERLFIGGCLLADIVVTGIFHGSLTKAWSKETYYENINTLQEVDKTGMSMVISSRIVKNLFGDDNSTLFESLRSKIVLRNITTLEQTAIYRNICTIERHSDVNIIMRVCSDI